MAGQRKRGQTPSGSVQLPRTADKRNGSKAATRSAPRSSNERAGAESTRSNGNGKLKRNEVIEVSDGDSSDAASGYNVSDSEEDEVPAGNSRTAVGVAAARSIGTKTSSLKKQLSVKKKVGRPKASRKEKEEDRSDGPEDEGMDEADDMSYYVSKNGRGRDGPLNINLPGADSNSWTSNDFCLLVNNGWRRDQGACFWIVTCMMSLVFWI
jgi:hypothetical protein